MANLLDSLQMTATPTGLLAMTPEEQQQARTLGLLALAGGMIKGDLGGGLSDFGKVYQSAQDNAAKNRFMGIQAQNLQSEVETRKAALAKQAELQKLLGQTLGAPAQIGQLGSGSFGIVPPPEGQPAIPQAPSSSGSRIGAMSPDTLALLKANGLDLVDVAKLARPDMQVANGYAYDRNTVRPGFLPQMNISQNGAASLVTLGPDGMPVVSLPKGAAQTQMANVIASKLPEQIISAAGTTNLRKGNDNREYPVNALTENSVLGPMLGSIFGGNAPTAPTSEPRPVSSRTAPADPLSNLPPPSKDVKPGTFVGNPANAIEGISNIPDPQARSDAFQSFRLQMKQQGATGGNLAPTPAGGYGMNTQEEAAAAAQKAKAESLARGEAERANTAADKGVQFKDFRDQLNIARNLLQLDPTHSVPGAIYDSALGSVGYATPGSKVAKQLDLVGAWMTQNIPKAPGSQSNFELQQYQQAAGQVGDKTIPVEQRMSALGTLEKLMNTWEARRAQGIPAPANTGSASGSWGSGWSIREKN